MKQDTGGKKENIKVSVIIPVYKVEKYLGECIDSVISQTLKDIEMICIDDASPDGCPGILDEYAGRESRLRVFHNARNRGQGYCRNLGLHEARGKYVYFLDSDDMISPAAMAELYEKAEAEDLDGIFFDSEVIYDDADLEKKYASYPAFRKGVYPEHPVPGIELFEMFIDRNEWTCYIQRQFWRREFIIREGVKFPVRAEHEDEVFAFEAILAADRVKYIKDRYFIRRYRYDSVMTARPAPKNFHGYFVDFYLMERFVRERGIKSRAAQKNMARLYEKMTRYYREMSKEHDLGALFDLYEAEDADRALYKELYYFFEESQRSYMHYGTLSDKIMKRASESPRLYIYGAGRLAEQVYLSLEMRGYIIEGFLVSDAEGNPKAYHGRPVTVPESIKERDGAFVIIAVTDGYRKEIEERLDNNGFEHCFFRE